MDKIRQASKALVSAIDEARREIPRGDQQAARELLRLCEAVEAETKSAMRKAVRSIERRTHSYRSVLWGRKLADPLVRQLIDIGYRKLAAELHPDRGGSHDDMARLNTVRARLRAAG